MGTWARLFGQLRFWIGDDAEEKKWSDAQLLDCCQLAINDYSLRLPKIATAQVAIADKAGTMPSDWLRTKALLVEDDTAALQPGTNASPGLESYVLKGNTIEVGDSSITSLDLTYQARYAVPDTYDGDAEVDVPLEDWECVLWLASAFLLSRDSFSDSSLQRWDDQGKRDDSPILPEHRWRILRYLDAVDVRRTQRLTTIPRTK